MSEPDDDESICKLADEFVEYCMFHSQSLTPEGIRERARAIPSDVARDRILDGSILHWIIASSNTTLDTVESILELAPDAVRQKDEGGGLFRAAHHYGVGALPIHLACFNADCPTSVIERLLDIYPGGTRQRWRNIGLPLHCYLMRAQKHEAWGYRDDDGNLIEETPSFPTGKLDYDIVRMLVQANPSSLVETSKEGMPMHVLCTGFDATLELGELLADDDFKCFEGFGEDEDSLSWNVPILHLLRNHLVTPFPTDLFRYLLEHNPSPMKLKDAEGSEGRDGVNQGEANAWNGEDDVSISYLNSGNPLHTACSNPNITVEAFQIILEECPEFAKDNDKHDGYLPIHKLCENGGLDDDSSLLLLELLLKEYPESLEMENNVQRLPWYMRLGCNEYLPIHLACIHKSFSFCKFILERSPRSASEEVLHHSHESKFRGSLVLPFHLACRHGSLDLVKCLLEKDPLVIQKQTEDSNFKYDEEVGRDELVKIDESLLPRGNYPLHLAVSRRNCLEKTEIIGFLLKQDPDASSKQGKWGNLPLHKACWDSCPDLNLMVQLLCSHPAAIHAKNVFGQLPIHLAMQSSDEDDFDGLVFLAKKAPNALGVLDVRGMSCAHYACTSKNALKKLEMIADIFPDAIRSKSNEHGFPIHFACKNGCKIDVVQLLASQFPESLNDHADSIGLPLHCSTGNTRLFHFLFSERYRALAESGTPQFHAFLLDEEVQNKDLILPHIYFLDEEKEDQFGRFPAHLIFGATRNCRTLEKVIGASYDSIDKQDLNGGLPLHYAMRHNASPEITKYMIGKRPEHVQKTTYQGSTPLHYACQYGCSLETVSILVGDDEKHIIETRDNLGRTVLHVACDGEASLDTIRLLLRCNKNAIAMRDGMGDLPLHTACRAGRLKVVKHLMKNDMRLVSARNYADELPIHLLCDESGKPDEVIESKYYTEIIFRLLVAYPETVNHIC